MNFFIWGCAGQNIWFGFEVSVILWFTSTGGLFALGDLPDFTAALGDLSLDLELLVLHREDSLCSSFCFGFFLGAFSVSVVGDLFFTILTVGIFSKALIVFSGWPNLGVSTLVFDTKAVSSSSIKVLNFVKVGNASGTIFANGFWPFLRRLRGTVRDFYMFFSRSASFFISSGPSM